MDGAATFADLIHDVLDFIAQDLVLLADFIQSEEAFLASLCAVSRSMEGDSALSFHSLTSLSTCSALRVSCSTVTEASVSLAWSFNLFISISSALATPSVSYLLLHMSDSLLALATCLKRSSLIPDSSSRCSLTPSSSCSRFLNLPRRAALSLASSSATRHQ